MGYSFRVVALMCRAKGRLGYRDRPLVETDFEASPSSGTFITKAVIMLELTFVGVVPWYTCELDHSFRVVVLMVQVEDYLGCCNRPLV